MERENEFDVMHLVMFANDALDQSLLALRAAEIRLMTAQDSLCRSMDEEIDKIRGDLGPDDQERFDRIAKAVDKIDDIIDLEGMKP